MIFFYIGGTWLNLISVFAMCGSSFQSATHSSVGESASAAGSSAEIPAGCHQDSMAEVARQVLLLSSFLTVSESEKNIFNFFIIIMVLLYGFLT